MKVGGYLSGAPHRLLIIVSKEEEESNNHRVENHLDKIIKIKITNEE